MEARRGPGRNVPSFANDELVMVKNPALHNAIGLTRKLTNTWTGPFKIIRRMGPTTYLVTGVAGRGRSVSVNRLKKFVDHEHAETEEADYANHFQTAGEPVPSEGNRTYAPAEDEAALEPGDGEAAPTASDEPVVDIAEEPEEDLRETQATEGGAVRGRRTQADDRPRRGRGRPRSAPPQVSRIVRRIEPGPELGMSEPVAPCGGLRNLCKRCHKPKRNHKCQGRYIPVRQLTAARRRLGLADEGARAIFGLVVREDKEATPEVFGVYAPNDVRKMNLLELPQDWETVAGGLGQDGDHIWNEECFKCEKKGKVYNCFGCNLVFHPHCSVRPLLSRRLRTTEEFLCPDCLRDCVDPDSPTVEVTMAEGDGDGGAPHVVAMAACASHEKVKVRMRPRWHSSWGCRHPGANTWSRLRRIPEHGTLSFVNKSRDAGKFYR